MSVQTLAITGGTGFVGQVLIRLALAQGLKVRALTRQPQPEKDGVTWISGALDQQNSLAELMRGVDGVIHVAGVVNAPDRAGFESGNVAGTLAVIEAARAGGVDRFIHVSSLSAREPGLSDYGWSKAKAETVVQASGLDWTIVRPPAIYGPGDREMVDIYKMAKRGFVLLPPAGRFSVIEVSDLGRLLIALVPAEEARAQLYEVDDGKDEGWTHQSYGKAIGWALGRPVSTLSIPKSILKVAARIDQMIRGGGAKLTLDRASYLSHPDWVISPKHRPPSDIWQPVIGTRDGLKATAAAYRAAGWI